jgi:Zn-dependent protease with chaperone function
VNSVRISVYVPLLVSLVLAAGAPPLARRLAPRPTAWALVCVATVTAAAWLGSLALLAFTALAQIPAVAREGDWSARLVRAEDPVGMSVAVASALLLALAVGAVVVAAVRQARALRWARREGTRLPAGQELTIIDDESAQAFVLPGAPGRIVVSRGMLRCLADDERAAMLAHERAHLRGRHHRFKTVWRLAAAANPLLRPLAAAGTFVLERWADEHAARVVGDRRVVARAVARAALAYTADRPPGSHGVALTVTGGAVPQRVRALFAPPPRPRALPYVIGAVLLAVCCVSLVEAASEDEAIVDGARHVPCVTVTRPADTVTPHLGEIGAHRPPRQGRSAVRPARQRPAPRYGVGPCDRDRDALDQD